MSTLQLTLLIIGIALILAVFIYNIVQERKLRRSFARPAVPQTPSRKEAEPTKIPAPVASTREEPVFEAPPAAPKPQEDDGPDFMAEAVLTLQLPPNDIQITPELAEQFLKVPGKNVRLLWQVRGSTHWSVLNTVSDITDHLNQWAMMAPTPPALSTENEGKEERRVAPEPTHSLAFCLQLADRAHVTTTEQIETFQKHVESIASLLSASYTPFDASVEAERARALDKICAQLDLQIGLTLHGKVGPMPGQSFLLAAQKQGFVLKRGALRYSRDGRELFRIEDAQPLSDERLKNAIQNPVVLLDVPHVPQPELVFDDMLKQTMRLAQTLSAELVDDRLKPLKDQGLTMIRTEVEKSTQALIEAGIEPGSRRALRLFSS